MRKRFCRALISLIRAAGRSKAWLELPIERRLLVSSNAIHKIL